MPRLAFPLAAAVLALAGCGGGAHTARGTISCGGTELARATGLPADFPKPGEVTYVQAVRAGPSVIVDGYWEGELEDAYEAYKREFESAGYGVVFDELERADSEVAYESADESTTGVVALRKRCREDGLISLHITNRPG